ncbi:MAG: site-2 protease family protein [Betaproteobacteria bacterium]
MKCQACSTETVLPFTCPYCGGQFCATHRLPENHACPKMNYAKAQRQDQVMSNQGYANYNYSYVYGQDHYKRKRPIIFSHKEAQHIGVAAALVVGIGFSIAWYSFTWTWLVMAVFAAILTVSFLVHEMAHKIMAQKAGLWAEFRLTTWGAVLTFASVFLPFKMIAPGAMMIGGQAPSAKDMLKISIAGVITNLIFGITFLALTFMLPPNMFTGALFFSAYINSFMALFNLIPFGVLDGYKIFRINKQVWALAFIPSVVLTAVTYLILIGII